MTENKFLLDEVLVNQNWKACMKLLETKIKAKEQLTLLEQALVRFVRLNHCLAELMGPHAQEILTEKVKENQRLMDQFPEFRKLFNAIDLMRKYHAQHNLPYTPIEDAFLRYLEVSTQAGLHLSGKKSLNDNGEKK